MNPFSVTITLLFFLSWNLEISGFTTSFFSVPRTATFALAGRRNANLESTTATTTASTSVPSLDSKAAALLPSNDRRSKKKKEFVMKVRTAEKNQNGAIGTILSIEDLLSSVQFRYGWRPKIEIFCRQSYMSIYQIMKDIIKSSVSKPVMLITGVPGIGKSLFSIFFMIQILTDDDFPVKSFLLEYAPGEYERISFVSKTSSTMDSCDIRISVEKGIDPDPEKDLILSDIQKEDEPKGKGRWTCIFSYPNPKRYKETMKAPHNYQITMPTWSEEELQAVNPKKDEWYDRFTKFGGVPRHVLWDGNGTNPDRKLNTTLKEKGGKVVDYFFDHEFGNIDLESSYMLVHMNPPKDPEGNGTDYQGEAVYSFASDEIFKILSKNHEKSMLARAINLFNAGVASEVYGGSTAGHIFEKVVLWLKPMALREITFISLEANEPEIKLTLPEMKVLAQQDWKEEGKLQVGVLYQPKISNLESGDSFCVVEVNGEYWLLVLQMTVGEKHPIKANGLKTIVMAFPESVRLKLKKKILGFVTPVDGKLDGVQALHTGKNTVMKNVPLEVKDFKQYVCRYEL